MPKTFSDRRGYRADDIEITVREDAPRELREAIPLIAKKVGMSPTKMREIVCEVLLAKPDPDNWSDYPNVWGEVTDHIETCLWFKVYDIAEALYAGFADQYESTKPKQFADRLNQVFREMGVGWEMRDGEIVYKGSEPFPGTTREAVKVLKKSGLSNAASEMREALKDISRRPEPDRTGAIQHAMAALEATARKVAGKPNPTLGQLVPQLDLPKPLGTAVDKLWGYASGHARHGKEGRTVDTVEAELVVSVACAVCTFLTKRDLHQS